MDYEGHYSADTQISVPLIASTTPIVIDDEVVAVVPTDMLGQYAEALRELARLIHVNPPSD